MVAAAREKEEPVRRKKVEVKVKGARSLETKKVD